MRRLCCIAIACVALFVPTVACADDAAPLVEPYLLSGKLADGESTLLARLKDAPQDDQARFGLGTLQFLRAIEHLSQSIYQYGGLSGQWTRSIPLLRAASPAGVNPNPQKITCQDVRKILQQWIDDLAKAEATLAGVKDPNVKLSVHFGLIKLDFNGDGLITDEEALVQLYVKMNRGVPVNLQDAREFVISFDAGDVHWLRGYCHLLSAMGEAALAHDFQELFDATAQVFFARPQSPHAWIEEGQRPFEFGQGVDLSDAIAFIHLLRLPVKEPQRMASALKHLQAMVAESRESWKTILAETDDDHEWIPNPKQTGVVGVRVTPEMVQAWQDFLAETDELLAGKKLIPFWRSKTGVGVNLNHVFTEPRQFDLVLWVQGTAATPYLEKGPLTDPRVWDRLMRVFQGEFIGYAFWFN